MADIKLACDKALAPDPKAKPELIEYIKNAATTPDLAGKIADEKVVFFGEFHPNLRAREYVAAQLKDLKALGFTVLAMEMFNSVDQPTVEAYTGGEKERSAVLQILKEKWGWTYESYQMLVDTAVRLDFKILALDNRDLQHDRLRDAHMAKVMADYIVAHPNERIVGYMGGKHASYSSKQSQRKILESRGISTVGFWIDFNHDLNRNNDPDWFPNETPEALTGDAFDKTEIRESVYVPFPKDRYLYDGYIFQP